MLTLLPMNESKQLLAIISIPGVLAGLMLGVYFIFFVRKKNLSHTFLGCLLLALTLNIAKLTCAYWDYNLCSTYQQIGLTGTLLSGPALLFFLSASMLQPAVLPRSWKYLIAGLLTIVLLGGILYPYAVYTNLWDSYLIHIIQFSWPTCVIVGATFMRGILSRIGSPDQPFKNAEKWILGIYMANVLLAASSLSPILPDRISTLDDVGGPIFTLAIAVMIFIHFYSLKITDQFYQIPEKYQLKKLKDEDAENLFAKLDGAMKQKELFKNASLTLNELAKAIGISSHQLSQLLNDNIGKNFTSYVNECRIEEACRMITNGHIYTLEAIGYEVGFNSKSTFYTAFKKVIGTTPMLYRDSLPQKNRKISGSLSIN